MVAAILEGTRPMLVEVQALVAPAGIGVPRRALVGVPADRLALLVAVLGRRCGLDISSQDLYVSLVGRRHGRASPRSTSRWRWRSPPPPRDVPLAPGTVACGEVSLLGGLRPVQGLERRLREAARLGFRQAIVPAGEDSERLGPAIAGPSGGQLRIDRGRAPCARRWRDRSGPVRYLRGRVLPVALW